MWFLNRSDTNRAIQAGTLDLESRGIAHTICVAKNCTIHVVKTKALISFAVTAKLICAFGFAYAGFWYHAAHIW